jgi:hypothetical protein
MSSRLGCRLGPELVFLVDRRVGGRMLERQPERRLAGCPDDAPRAEPGGGGEHGAMRTVPALDVVLEPRECLFIPLSWWHWVKLLEIKISLTFTNFHCDDPPAVWQQVMA